MNWKKGEIRIQHLRESLSFIDIKEFARFIIVGCSNFLVSFTVFYLVYRYGKVTDFLTSDAFRLGPWLFSFLDKRGIQTLDGAVANVCGYSAGILNSFIWNKKWTFQARKKTGKQFKRFVFLNFFCLGISTFFIFVYVDIFCYPYKPTWFAVGVATTLINYFGYKYWVFKSKV